MSLLKSRIIGLLMVIFAIVFGLWYTLCIVNNGIINGKLHFFKDETFYGIPLLNEYKLFEDLFERSKYIKFKGDND